MYLIASDLGVSFNLETISFQQKDPIMLTNKYPFIAIIALLLSTALLQSQNPSDCIGAIPICQEVYYEEFSYPGVGEIENEVSANLSCFGNASTGQVEINSVWYVFSCQSSGDLCFDITPNDYEDYDYGVYNVTNMDCADIALVGSLEVSCNFAPNLGCGGVTGANGNNEDTFDPCAGQNEPCVPVEIGETYVILVTNYSGTENGYTIDFSASTANIIDNSSPVIADITELPNEDQEDTGDQALQCGSSDFLLKMTENIMCDQLTADLVAVENMMGISNKANQLIAPDCELGGIHDNKYQVQLSSPLNPGVYKLSIDLGSEAAPSMTDVCGNSTTQSPNGSSDLNKQFTVGNEVSFTGELDEEITCKNGIVKLEVIDPASEGTYSWVLEQEAGNYFLGQGSTLELNSSSFAAATNSVSVYYINESTCSFSTPKEVTVTINEGCDATGIAEETLIAAQAFPNPAADYFQIELKENATAQIFTFDGKRVQLEECSMGTNRIDISDLQSGIYLLSISNGSLQYSSKLIVE